MTQIPADKVSPADVEAAAIQQILALRTQTAALESQLEGLRTRADDWARSRWGRIGALASESRLRERGGLVRFGLGAVRALGNGSRTPQTKERTTAARVHRTSAPEPARPCVSDESAAERSQRLAPAVESGRKLVVASIMDAFTRSAFDPECRIVDLHPSTWLDELESSFPDLLFIESAWRGHDDSWYDTVQTRPRELVDIVEWCRDHGVPTVFWNKEDPVYYDRYIKVAELFDHVFTTDLDVIPRYVRDLGHRRVHVLPFAAQPLVCNPIETAERKEAVVFAGSYYAGFKERNKSLFAAIEGASRVLPVEIYDRNLGSDKDFFQWPEPFGRLVVGTLPPDQIDVAYKGYRVALNVNTVTSSQTMLARRAFDLLASGTPTVSNFSRSIKVLFGDLVPASNSAEQIEAAVRQIVDDPDTSDKRRAMGVRHIIRRHTYSARFRQVIETTSGARAPQARSRVGLVAVTDDVADVGRWLDLARAHVDRHARLLVVTDDGAVEAMCAAEGVATVSTAAADATSLGQVFDDVDFVAVLRPEHWYGPHYLHGLLDAMVYSTAPVVAKVTRFRAVPTGVDVVDHGNEYRWWEGAAVPWHRALVRFDHCSNERLGSLVTDPAASVPFGMRTVGIDRFDFCELGRAPLAARRELTADLPIQVGAPLEAILAAEPDEQVREVAAASFPSDVVRSRTGCIVRATDEGVLVAWAFDDAKPTYVRFRDQIPISEISGTGELYLRLQAQGSGSLGVNVSWFDAGGTKLPGLTYYGQSVHRIPVPENATRVALFLTLKGTGTAVVRSLALSPHDFTAPVVLEGWAARTLVVTDGYPDYGDRYRNGFVHTRLRGYRANGVAADVYVLRGTGSPTYREYEGVQVTTGAEDGLRQLLSSGRYEQVLVHFLNARMWSVLREHLGSVGVTVWSHGSDIQPWWRRQFNYRDEADVSEAKRASDARMELWRDVSTTAPEDIGFVFVSQAFRDEVAEDQAAHGFGLDERSVRIVHNPVDTDLFAYEPKDAAQRTKILLIRPFASKKYGNDLAVAAILELAKEPWFPELSFDVYGDGPLFAEETAPLAGYTNVKIERRFLSHQEIAALHKEHGVFLVPTRHDTQGVSRDEAMSSGLVPVTSDVPAVREFVSETEGYIAGYEDVRGLADAIRDLYHHPEVFAAKSKAAAERVRRTVASSIIIPQEIALFTTSTNEGDHL